MVKNVSKYVKEKDQVRFISEKFRVLGINWIICVAISAVDAKSADKSKWVEIFLYAQGNYTKE